MLVVLLLYFAWRVGSRARPDPTRQTKQVTTHHMHVLNGVLVRCLAWRVGSRVNDKIFVSYKRAAPRTPNKKPFMVFMSFVDGAGAAVAFLPSLTTLTALTAFMAFMAFMVSEESAKQNHLQNV